MEIMFQQIKCLAEDIRLNPLITSDIRDFELRQIEDLCTMSIKYLSEKRAENN